MKSKINAILKDLNASYVTAEVDHYHHKTILRQKAFRGGSIGPLTVTTAHYQHCHQVNDRLKKEFGNIAQITETPSFYGDMKNITLVIKLTDKLQRHMEFSWQLLRTYATNEYDPSYMTYWLVLTTTDAKIKDNDGII